MPSGPRSALEFGFEEGFEEEEAESEMGLW